MKNSEMEVWEITFAEKTLPCVTLGILPEQSALEKEIYRGAHSDSIHPEEQEAKGSKCLSSLFCLLKDGPRPCGIFKVIKLNWGSGTRILCCIPPTQCQGKFKMNYAPIYGNEGKAPYEKDNSE